VINTAMPLVNTIDTPMPYARVSILSAFFAGGCQDITSLPIKVPFSIFFA
jgi:hypothetical protein